MGKGNETLKVNAKAELNPSKEKPGSNISLIIFNGAHQFPADLEGLPIRSAQIYIPEIAGVDPATRTVYRNIAAGKLKPTLEIAGDPARLAEMEKLFNSKVIVVFTDVEKGNPHAKRLPHHWVDPVIISGQITYAFVEPTFEQALDRVRNSIVNTSWIETQRLKQIWTNLKPALRQVIKQSPLLAQLPEIRVLMFLGQAHGDILRKAKDDPFFHSAQPFYKDPFKFHYIEAQSLADRKQPINDELAAKILFESLCYGLFMYTLKKQNPRWTYVHSILYDFVSQFSLEEIKEICEHIRTGTIAESLLKEEARKRGLTQLVDNFVDPKVAVWEEE